MPVSSAVPAPRPIWDISDADWRLGIETNLSSAFYCSRAVAKHMVDRGQGKIINVSSGFGLRGGRDNYMYTTAKGGIVQLTRTLAMSLGRYGVTSTCIVPGFIPTEATAHAAGDPAPEQVHPHRQGWAAGRDRARGGVPRVGSLRLYERGGLRRGRRRTGGRICADGLRARSAPDYLTI